nr:hypothetical protein [Baekduia soli]
MDDRRPGDPVAGPQARPRVDRDLVRRVAGAVGERHAGGPGPGRRGVGVAGPHAGVRPGRDGRGGHDPQVDDLDRVAREVEAVLVEVLGAEALGDLLAPVLAQRVAVGGELIALPGVAAGGLAVQDGLGAVVAGEARTQLVLHLAEARLERLALRRREHDPDGADVVVAQVGGQQAHRRGDAGRRRQQDDGDLELLGDLAPVQRAGPAEGDERALARVVAAADGVHADLADHVGVDDRQDRQRRLLDVHAELAADPGHGLPRRGGVQAQAAVEELVGVDAPEDDVGVGHRRLRPALAVGRRAGLRARAARADVERAALVAPRDGAAPGADGGDVELGGEDGVAAHLALARVHLQQPAGDDADVRRRAADVERDELVVAVGGADVAAGDDPGGGPRQQDVDRVGGRLVDGRHAAVGLHDVDRAPHARLAPPGLEALEVAAHLRLDVGVGRRRREALELAELGDDLVREGDLGVGMVLGDELAGAQLVARVQEGEQEADADRLHAPVLELEDRLDRARLVERDRDLARGHDALGDRLAVLALHQRPALVGDVLHEREVVRPLVAADVDDVAEALRRQHPGAPAVVLEERVGGDRGAVEDQVDVRGRDAGDVADLVRALDGAARRIIVRRRQLVDDDALLEAPEDDVGVRSAHVDAEADHAAPCVSCRWSGVRSYTE